MNLPLPLTEAELHAFVDGELTPERQREIDALLAARPDEAQRVQAYREQKRELRALFDPVLAEPVPPRVLRAARPPRAAVWTARRWAAGVAIALIGGAAGWGLRGALAPASLASSAAASTLAEAGFAQRAAIAHAVYSPEQRRPVEVDAAHEDQLVTWLSKRMGAPMKPPHLQALGYALEGGRLLPGGQGPVAQFMYRDAAGQRLTLYVSNEIGAPSAAASGARVANTETAFRFAREGKVNVFYWVEGRFGYAISAEVDRAVMTEVSAEVYRQLAGAGVGQ
ncbi:MAG TPA: anti-sigma factor [Burkholderiaceae bacterium]